MKTVKSSSSQKEQGSLLKDLLSSTSIPLKRERIPKCALALLKRSLPPEKTIKGQTKSHSGPCSTCGYVHKKCQLLTLKEIEQLKELLRSSTLSVEVTGLLSQWNICPHCSRILERLRILKGEIEQITHALRAVIKIQINKNGGFHPGFDLEQTSRTRDEHEEVGLIRNDSPEEVHTLESNSNSGNDYPELEAKIILVIRHELTDNDETDEEMETLEIDAGVDGRKKGGKYKDEGHSHKNPTDIANNINSEATRTQSPCPTNDTIPNLDQRMELELTDIGETDDEIEILQIDSGNGREEDAKDQDEDQSHNSPANIVGLEDIVQTESTRTQSSSSTNDPSPNLDQTNNRLVCPQCGTSFSRMDGLIRHKKNVHHGRRTFKKSQRKLLSRQAGPLSSKKVKVKCHLCLLTYSSEYSLGRHLRSLLHKEGTKSRKINANGEVSFECNLCHAEFTRLVDLLSHKKAHPKRNGRAPRNQMELNDDDWQEINELDSRIEIKIDPGEDEDEQKPIVLHTEIELMEDQEMIRDEEGAEESDKSTTGDQRDQPAQIETGDDLMTHCNPIMQNMHSLKLVETESEEVGAAAHVHKNCGEAEMWNQVRSKRACRVRAEELFCSLVQADNANVQEDDNESEGSESDMESETGSDSDESKSNSNENDGEKVTKVKKKVKSPGLGPGNWRKWPRLKGPPIHPLECVVCGNNFPNSKLLKHHSSQHPVNKCDICDRKYNSGIAYIVHLRSLTHHLGKRGRRNDNGVITFACQDCDVSFSTVRLLAVHRFKVHSEEGKAAAKRKKELYKTPQCDLCQKVFKSLKDLERHLLTDRHAEKVGEEAVAELEKLKTFQCDHCPKRYSHKALLRTHVATHTIIPQICEICGKRLMNIKRLQLHISNVHSDKPKQKSIPKKPNMLLPPQDKPFPCKKCGRRFTTKATMKNHFKTIHEGFRLKCHHCPRDFFSSWALKKHCNSAHGGESGVSNTKTPPVKAKNQKCFCDICSKPFIGKFQVGRHIELKHFPEKNHCPYGCSDKMENEQEWRVHLETCKSEKLTEASKCFCFFCGDVFSSRLLKIDHHLRTHTTFPCEFCDRAFTRKGILDYHVYEHEESKPWLCPKCGKRFRQRYNLDIHSTAVCGEDETAKKELIAKRRELHRIYRNKAKPYKCTKCPKAFVEERRLEDHTRKVHENKKKNNNSETDEEKDSD